MYITISTIIILLCTTSTHTSAENKSLISSDIPELFPYDHQITNSTIITEHGYHYTKNASQKTIIIGPCAPCVGMQVCDIESDTCFYAHMHVRTDAEDLIKKIHQSFTIQDSEKKPTLDVTIFTRTNEHHFSNWHFPEGNHKQRTLHLADKLSQAFNVQKIIIYYKQTAEDIAEKNNNYDDRYIIFIDKKIYRINPAKYTFFYDYRMRGYMEKKYKKNFGLRAYSIVPWNIWGSYNVPLYTIKKANTKKICAQPAYNNDPFAKFLAPFYIQIASILLWKSGLNFLAGIIINRIYSATKNRPSNRMKKTLTADI